MCAFRTSTCSFFLFLHKLGSFSAKFVTTPLFPWFRRSPQKIGHARGCILVVRGVALARARARRTSRTLFRPAGLSYKMSEIVTVVNRNERGRHGRRWTFGRSDDLPRNTVTDNGYLPIRKFDGRSVSTCGENGMLLAFRTQLVIDVQRHNRCAQPATK